MVVTMYSRFHPVPFRDVCLQGLHLRCTMLDRVNSTRIRPKYHYFIRYLIEANLQLIQLKTDVRPDRKQQMMEDPPGLRNTFFSQLFINDRIIVNTTAKANVA